MSKGVESIRIKGQRVQELPLGMGNEAKAGLPAAIEQERINAIETINASYPKHRIDYLVSRINECEQNKDRMRKTIGELNTMTSDYKGHIAMCKHRDELINKLDPDHAEYKERVRRLKKQYPPYNVSAMELQIMQNGEGIERCNDVIDAEDKSIKEFTEVMTLCRERDKKLAEYGAIAEGS